MATLERRSITDLVKAVGAVIDMDITNNSSPELNQVKQWLTDGAIKLFGLLPPEALSDCIKVESHNGASITAGDFGSDVFRVTALKLNGITCTKITEDEFDLLSMTPYKYTLKNPAYCAGSESTGFTVRSYPEFSSNSLVVKYIPKPFNYVDEDGNYDASDRDYSVPATLEPMIVDYASIMYRNQDEEPGQFQLYITEWKENIKVLFQVPAQNADGSY